MGKKRHSAESIPGTNPAVRTGIPNAEGAASAFDPIAFLRGAEEIVAPIIERAERAQKEGTASGELDEEVRRIETTLGTLRKKVTKYQEMATRGSTHAKLDEMKAVVLDEEKKLIDHGGKAELLLQQAPAPEPAPAEAAPQDDDEGDQEGWKYEETDDTVTVTHDGGEKYFFDKGKSLLTHTRSNGTEETKPSTLEELRDIFQFPAPVEDAEPTEEPTQPTAGEAPAQETSEGKALTYEELTDEHKKLHDKFQRDPEKQADFLVKMTPKYAEARAKKERAEKREARKAAQAARTAAVATPAPSEPPEPQEAVKPEEATATAPEADSEGALTYDDLTATHKKLYDRFRRDPKKQQADFLAAMAPVYAEARAKKGGRDKSERSPRRQQDADQAATPEPEPVPAMSAPVAPEEQLADVDESGMEAPQYARRRMQRDMDALNREAGAPPSPEQPAEEVLADEPLVPGERIPKEEREKLRALLGKMERISRDEESEQVVRAEAPGPSFAEQNERMVSRERELDQEAEKRGWLGKVFHSLDMKFRKLSPVKKFGVGLGLGLGAAAFSTFSLPALLALIF